MSDQMLKSAKLEETRLVSELERSPTYRRLMAVRHLIEAYDQPGAVQTFEPAPEKVTSRPVARATARSASQAASVVATAKEYLEKKGARAETKEILNALQEQGLRFASANPQASLSSALSHHEAFDNVRKQGYGLVEWSTGAHSEAPNRPADVTTIEVGHGADAPVGEAA